MDSARAQHFVHLLEREITSGLNAADIHLNIQLRYGNVSAYRSASRRGSRGESTAPGELASGAGRFCRSLAGV